MASTCAWVLHLEPNVNGLNQRIHSELSAVKILARLCCLCNSQKTGFDDEGYGQPTSDSEVAKNCCLFACHMLVNCMHRRVWLALCYVIDGNTSYRPTQ